MRFKKSLMLDVYVYTEEEEKLKELDIETEFTEDSPTEKRYFFCIDSVHQYREMENVSYLYSNGDSFYVKGKADDLVRIIEDHIVAYNVP